MIDIIKVLQHLLYDKDVDLTDWSVEQLEYLLTNLTRQKVLLRYAGRNKEKFSLLRKQTIRSI